MVFKSAPRAGNLMMRVLGFLALVVVMFALFIAFVPNTVPQAEKQEEQTDDSRVLSRRCEDDLAGLIEGLEPGRLGISSDRDALIHRLNGWKSECLSLTDAPVAGAEVEAAKQLLSGETLTRTLSEKYLPEDASHVRSSLLMRDIVTRLTEGKASNLHRYAALFEFVCLNEMLVPKDEVLKDVPLTPYEALLFGMGAPEHRAWTFAELLRQMRTDAVIIAPQGEKLADEWLIGVIDPKAGIFLFDPRLGMPIPAPNPPENDNELSVATLAQVQESDLSFRQLDIPDSPYPLKSEDMKSLKVSLIGTSCSWAPRMAKLQFLLPVKFSTELFDGLVESELRAPGLRQRIIDAGQGGGWSADDVLIWSYPEEQLLALEATRGEGTEGTTLANFFQVFKGPYVPQIVDKEGKYNMVPVDKSLHFVRVEQLQGNQTAAMKDYLPIRSAAKIAPSRGNELAAEYAALWTGMAQYESRKYNAAFNTFGRFVNGQASSIGLLRCGIEWGAQCLVHEKEYTNAIKLLEQAPPGLSPRRDALLIRKWQKLGGIDPTKAPQKSAPGEKQPEPPAESKEAEKAEMKAPDSAKSPAAPTEPKPMSDAAKPAEESMKKPAGDKPAPPEMPMPADSKENGKEGADKAPEKTPEKEPAPKTPEPAPEDKPTPSEEKKPEAAPGKKD